MNSRQIGLFGGSFDPPHSGHQALVAAGLAAGLDEVWVIPALPVHRQLSGHATADDRFHWLSAMFAEQSQVRVLDWEIRQQRPTPAIDTLRMFGERHPGTSPWLMLGSDAWAGISEWRAYPEHLQHCNVAVFARRGLADAPVCAPSGWQQRNSISASDCQQTGQWIYIASHLPDISATTVREQAGSGQSLAGMVPEQIRREIEQAYSRAGENK